MSANGTCILGIHCRTEGQKTNFSIGDHAYSKDPVICCTLLKRLRSNFLYFSVVWIIRKKHRSVIIHSTGLRTSWQLAITNTIVTELTIYSALLPRGHEFDCFPKVLNRLDIMTPQEKFLNNCLWLNSRRCIANPGSRASVVAKVKLFSKSRSGDIRQSIKNIQTHSVLKNMFACLSANETLIFLPSLSFFFWKKGQLNYFPEHLSKLHISFEITFLKNHDSQSLPAK